MSSIFDLSNALTKGNFASSLQNIAIPLIGVLLAIAVAAFIGYFFLPGWRLKQRLTNASAALQQTKIKSEGNITDLSQLGKVAFKSGTLEHLWKEYCETLHPERDTDGSSLASRVF